MQRNYVNKVLPLLLVICLIASSIPMTAWASEASPDNSASTFDDFPGEITGQSSYGISETGFASASSESSYPVPMKIPDCWYGALPGESSYIMVPDIGDHLLFTHLRVEPSNADIKMDLGSDRLYYSASDATPPGIYKVKMVYSGFGGSEELPDGRIVTKIISYDASEEFLFCVWEKDDKVIEVTPTKNPEMQSIEYNVRTRNMGNIMDFVVLSTPPSGVSSSALLQAWSWDSDRGDGILQIHTNGMPFEPGKSAMEYDGVVSNEFEIKYYNEEAELSGTVLVDGEALVGKTLEANTSELTSNQGIDMGKLSYQWYRASKDNRTGGTTNHTTYPISIKNATDSTYTPTQDDIDYTLTVTVTASNCNGSVTSEETDYIFQRVGYSFGNVQESFGYPSYIDANPINQAVYQRVFPNCWEIVYRKDKMKKWGGHCGAMASTTQLFRTDLLKEEDFQYEATETWEFIAPGSLIRLRSEIEAYAIVYNKPEVRSLYRPKDHYSELIYITQQFETQKFEVGKKIDPIVMTIVKYDIDEKRYIRHAVVPYRFKDRDQGDVDFLYVYDPNYPYSKENPILYNTSIVFIGNIDKNTHFWSYDGYDSRKEENKDPMYPAYFQCINAAEISRLLETPTFIEDSAVGAETNEAVTLTVSGQSVVMETYDLEDASGMVSRNIKVGAGENSYSSQDFFIAETKGEMSITADAFENDIFAYIYNANGGAIIDAQASIEDAPYTFTVEPGISAKLSGDENKRDITMVFAFSAAEGLVLFDMNARAAGDVTLARVNENDILISGKDIENLVISQDDKNLLTLANAPDNVILRMEYENDGTIKSAAFYSDTNEELIDKELVSRGNTGGKTVGKATIVDYLMGKNKTDQTNQTEPQNQTQNNSQSQIGQGSSSPNTPANGNEEKSAIPGFGLIFAVAAVAGLVGVGTYQKKKNGKK